jgi:beta-lactam-binding protein with PASTA domain
MLGACGTGPSAEVPDLSGLSAETALARVEAVDGLRASFDESPVDPARCTVEGQDPTGSVERGTEVVIQIACRVKVPDVTGFGPRTALAEVDSVLSLSGELGPGPGERRRCIIQRQRPRAGALVRTGTHVVVFPDCR